MFLGRVRPSIKEIHKSALLNIATEEVMEEEWKGRREEERERKIIYFSN